MTGFRCSALNVLDGPSMIKVYADYSKPDLLFTILWTQLMH